MTTPLAPQGRLILRAVLLRRYENALALSSGRILARTFQALEDLLRRQPPDGVSLGRQAARLQSLANQASDILADGYRELRQVSGAQLLELANLAGEAAVQEVTRRLFERGVDFSPLRLPSKAQFAAIITHDPIQGATLADWWQQFEAGSRNRFRREVQLGMTRRETVDQIVRRIRGLVLRRVDQVAFRGGMYRRASLKAETLVRTAVNEVNNAAAVLSYRRNADVVQGVEWLATLDDRTCPKCFPLDGKRWALDDPALRRPPEHPRCRCTTLPVLIGIPARDRVTYDEWLAAQPAAVQDRVLGQARGALYRQERLKLDELIRRDGGFVTLEVLRTRYPDAT